MPERQPVWFVLLLHIEANSLLVLIGSLLLLLHIFDALLLQCTCGHPLHFTFGGGMTVATGMAIVVATLAEPLSLDSDGKSINVSSSL
jgi:hypothetical protein